MANQAWTLIFQPTKENIAADSVCFAVIITTLSIYLMAQIFNPTSTSSSFAIGLPRYSFQFLQFSFTIIINIIMALKMAIMGDLNPQTRHLMSSICREEPPLLQLGQATMEDEEGEGKAEGEDCYDAAH